MKWVAPEFSAYPLGAQYTHWIYSDPQSNPAYYDRPDKWPEAGFVSFQDREILTVLPSGPSVTTVDLILAGGKNCVVFARYASVLSAVVNDAQQLPTQLWGYVDYAQRLTEGYFETQETVVANVFGTGWSPHTFPAPITWNDKLRRQFLLRRRDNLGGDLTVSLNWKVAFLNTGA